MKTKLLSFAMMALVLVSCFMSACTNKNTTTTDTPDPTPVSREYTFTDDLGRSVTVNNPQRVVTVMGSFAEIYALAGGAETIVGSTDDTIDTRDLGIPSDVAKIGSYLKPNVEAIIALNPDLVILTSSTADTVAADQKTYSDLFSDAGINTAYFTVTHFPDYLHMLKICTDITGKTDAYKKYGLDVQERVNKIIADNKVSGSPTYMLLITYSAGIRPQQTSSMTGNMLTELGAHNIIDDHPSYLRQLSMEMVLEEDPDYLFVIAMGNDSEAMEKALKDNITSQPAFNSLTCVKEGRYHVLPYDTFMFKPNDKWDEAYQYLADILNGK
jgi:iron complex transport system substrate-binding protein